MDSVTGLLSPRILKTVVKGRIASEDIEEWEEGFKKNPRDIWVFDATQTTSYSAQAVAEAGAVFLRCGSRGLRYILPAIQAPLVRMGASVVRLTLHATTSVRLEVFDSITAAEGHAHRLLRESNDP